MSLAKLFVGCSLMLCGCPSTAVTSVKESTNPQTMRNGCPPIFEKGKRACPPENGKAARVCDVGIAVTMNDVQLRRTASEEDGRVKIARRVKSEVDAIYKLAKSRTARGTTGATDSNTQESQESAVDLDLAGVASIDHCIDNSGTEYSIMELDADGLKQALASAKGLDAETKQEVEAKADQMYDELTSFKEKSRSGK